MQRDQLRRSYGLTDIDLNTLKAEAVRCDTQNLFPTESIAILRRQGVLALSKTPDIAESAAALALIGIAADIGALCPALGTIWSIHAHQVLTLRGSKEATPALKKRILTDSPLIASVTTEYAGTDLIEPSTLARQDAQGVITMERRTPIVSYGGQADAFLMTACLEQNGHRTPALLYADRDDIEVSVEGPWNAMGMRATQSVPMTFRARTANIQVVASPMQSLLAKVYLPFGHLLYAASWYGAAQAAFEMSVNALRQMSARKLKQLDSDLLRERVAICRMNLHLLECMLLVGANHIQAAQLDNETWRSASFSVAVNNLKLAGSRLALEIVNSLIDVVGAARGYTVSTSSASLEKFFRDLRAAPLMYHNDRLTAVNGQLAFLEQMTRTVQDKAMP